MSGQDTVTAESTTPDEGSGRVPLSPPRLAQPLAASALGLGTLTVTTAAVIGGGPVVDLDLHLVTRNVSGVVPGAEPVAEVVVRLGQRAVTIPFVVAAAYVAWRRLRTWRPWILAVAAVLTLNLVVGGLKIVTARPSPRTGDPDLFTAGMLYPSGHAANAVLMWGLVVYLLARSRRRRYAGYGAVAAVALVVGACSVYLNTHWLSDLVAGYAAGAAILACIVAVDRALPDGGARPHR